MKLQTLLVLMLGGSFFCGTLGAQVPKPVVEVSGGAMGFLEATEPFVGGAARFYVLPRVSLGPEVTYINGDNHSHVMVTGNFIFDFLSPRGGEQRRVTPFGLVGGGIFYTSERFRVFQGLPIPADFNSTEGAFTLGGGVRTVLGNRLTLGADVRVGWELHIRLGGTIGFRLGR